MYTQHPILTEKHRIIDIFADLLKKEKLKYSSSPLLSQVPAKLAINLSIHTQHTYDKGVDRTGRQGIEENTALTWGKWKKKKTDYAPWGVQCENRKKTPQHKSTYTINTRLLQQEEHIQLQQAAIRSSSNLFRRRSQTRLTGWRFKANGGEGWGEGKWVHMCVCVCVCL